MLNPPHFIIIGAMKCATSSLYQQLVAQPGIFMTTPKEPNFFSDDEIYAQGIPWYEALFADAPPDALRGEASTHYTKLPTYPETIARIQSHLGAVKLIYVMRHPVQRLVSHYIHEWTQRVIATKTNINAALDRHPELIDYSRYSMQIRPYLETFGPDNVLPVFFEQLCNAPQQELERVCTFIGYPQAPQWQDLERDNVSSQRMRKNKIRDAIAYAPGISTIRKNLIPKEVREWVKDRWRMQKRPELGAAERERVTAILDQDLAQLGAWLGVDLTCATFKTAACTSPTGWPGWQPRVNGASGNIE